MTKGRSSPQVTGGRAPKQKGYRLENQTRLYLCEAGLDCKRVPLSGAGDEKGDLRLSLAGGRHSKASASPAENWRSGSSTRLGITTSSY
jgi:hypothetical protein